MTPDNDQPDQREDLRAEIEETRDQLAHTAAALADKADVKARAHDKVEEAKATVREKVAGAKSAATEHTPPNAQQGARQAAQAAQANPIPTAAIAAGLAGLLLGWSLGRRRA